MKITAVIEHALRSFNLSPIETSIYIAAVASPESTVKTLAQKVGIDRTLLYFHLKNLSAKEMVRLVKKGRSQVVQAVDSEELVARMESWTDALKKVSPLLSSLALVDSMTPKISVKDFKTGHYDHYRELASLPEGSEFRVVQSDTSARSDLAAFKPGEWEFLLKQFVERKIETKALFTENLLHTAKNSMTPKEYTLFKKRTWHIRTPREDRFEVEEMMIHGDVVTFLLTDVGMLVRIEHPRIAKAMRTLFDALWITGTPTKFPE
ncbi:MAG: hypothetical protein KIH62_002700 [Candidatus Kerfeldbacteria bacterium]|nr:hypothetical protein [Candidatus Kerfeldbacteria bacterium]